jgi:uncharacterized protein (TIGR02001 family)
MPEVTRLLKICGSVLLLMSVANSALAQSSSGISEMMGEINIMSNYVDKGITQSNKSACVLTNIRYEIGQGKIGVQAANVQYENEETNLKAGIFGEYKFVFTANTDLRIRNDLVRYFSDSNRSKIQVLLDQNLFSYHVLLMREDNFEGTKKTRNWYGFGKDWLLSGSFILNTTVGYSMVDSFDNFFDVYLGVTYKGQKISPTLATTYVSNSSQFNGAADLATFLVLNIQF